MRPLLQRRLFPKFFFFVTPKSFYSSFLSRCTFVNSPTIGRQSLNSPNHALLSMVSRGPLRLMQLLRRCNAPKFVNSDNFSRQLKVILICIRFFPKRCTQLASLSTSPDADPVLSRAPYSRIIFVFNSFRSLRSFKTYSHAFSNASRYFNFYSSHTR